MSITLAILLALTLCIGFASMPALAQEDTDTEGNESTGPQIESVDHEFQFSGIQAEIRNQTLKNYHVILHNPTNESGNLMVEGIDGMGSRTVIKLEPGETVEYNLSARVFNANPFFSWATINEPIPANEVEGEDDMDISDTSLSMSHQILELVDSPWVPHEIVIVLLGSFVPFLTMGGGYMINSRRTRLAIPKNRSLDDLRSVINGPSYDWDEDTRTSYKLAVFTKDWIKAWGLLILSLIICLWGFLRLFGVEFAGEYTIPFLFWDFTYTIPVILDNAMVYLLYSHMLVGPIGLLLGFYIAKTKWTELSDVGPAIGDNYLYWLSPDRFSDMDVICEVRNPDVQDNNNPFNNRGEPISYDVPKQWLYSINPDTKRDSYECIEYDIEDNIAKVSWSGELKQLNPSQVRSSKKTIKYVFETSMWAIDRYHKFMDFYAHDVHQEARYMMARQTAIMEEAQMDGLENTRDRVERRMESRNEAEALEGNALETAEELQEQKPDDYELMENSGESPQSQDPVTRQGGDAE
ncbi:hypothetical protein JMJ58_03790 [Haloterrigena salifodinae]|uniref:Uncharacterized protein n=1 Tax=Haloterrigena salifodinae TaxID=2675099 RepID=A0A8T8E3Q3_9EURY|nr:hypothetical protein [Haloterrigena salifodinae]QRV16031.1 hypothetical protein JMJ58_03790 [Haloterrigena salifodinae]